MRAALALPSLAALVLASCGRHDTPLAAYLVPSSSASASGGTPAASGGAGAAGEAAIAGDAGTAAEGGQAGAPPELVCPPSYTLSVAGLTSRYREVTTGRGWVEAEQDCESDGGHLIVIGSQAENDYAASFAEKSLTDVKSTHQLAWLGADDSRTEGEFRWVTDRAFSLTFWSGADGAGGAGGAGGADGADGEPNSLFDDEDCVEIRASGGWNDDRCNAALVYLCECDGAISAGEWCDSSLNTSCGDCDTACASDQSCVKQQCG